MILDGLNDFVLHEKVSLACLDKYRDKIPAERLEIWENYGFGTFFGGVQQNRRNPYGNVE